VSGCPIVFIELTFSEEVGVKRNTMGGKNVAANAIKGRANVLLIKIVL
jgi:hypothetical protein